MAVVTAEEPVSPYFGRSLLFVVIWKSYSNSDEVLTAVEKDDQTLELPDDVTPDTKAPTSRGVVEKVPVVDLFFRDRDDAF